MNETSNWPDRWPGYLPLPHDITRDEGPASVPNEAFAFWPQGQFAPNYLPPGSASFQPYRYPKNAPLEQFQPMFVETAPALVTKQENQQFFVHHGPPGDMNAVRTKPWPAQRLPHGKAAKANCGCGTPARQNPSMPSTPVLVGLAGLAGLALLWGSR